MARYPQPERRYSYVAAYIRNHHHGNNRYIRPCGKRCSSRGAAMHFVLGHEAWPALASSICLRTMAIAEVVSFVYGDACDLPTGISTTAITSTRFSIGCGKACSTILRIVRYREAGTLNWYDNNIALNSVEIGSLKPGTVYEYQVAVTCGFYDGQYSPHYQSHNRAGSRKPSIPAAYRSMPSSSILPYILGSLKAGDIIMAGDFDVKVTKIAGKATARIVAKA